MNTQSQISLEQSLKDAHKARRARWEAMARKAKANDNALVRLIMAEPDPLWMQHRLRFDAHVQDFRLWQSRAGCRLRSHVAQRCKDFELPFNDVTGNGRKRYLILPRQIIQWELFNFDPKPSLRQIGTIFSDRDHATIIFAVRKIQGMIDRGELIL